MTTRSLSLADVVSIHARTMESMGERAPTLRDQGLLESAVLRPQMAAYYEAADLVRQATLLAVGASQNQPFVDGKKRAAYMAATVFLRVNGHPFTGEPMALARELEAVATRIDSLDAATARFEDWLRTRTG